MSTPYNIAFACLECRKSFKREVDITGEFVKVLKCPDCSGYSFNLGRYFKAPKKTDIKQWKKVAFLINHGFYFQKIYDKNRGGERVAYPETLQEAKEFVVSYIAYARELP